MDPDTLKKTILDSRDGGRTRIEIQKRGSADDQAALIDLVTHLDDLAKQKEQVSKELKEISRDLATRILTQILYKDMAYRQPTMDEGRASNLAEAFTSLFAAEAKFFSNMGEEFVRDMRKEAAGYSCNTITSATFNAGVFAIDADRAGFILIEDED